MKKTTVLATLSFLASGGSALAADLPVMSEQGPKGKVTITTTIPNATRNRPPMPYGLGFKVEKPNGNSGSISIDHGHYGETMIRGNVGWKF